MAAAAAHDLAMIPDFLRPLMPIKRLREPAPLVSVLRLDGVIGTVGPLRRGLDAGRLDAVIERAFAPKRLAAVALVVNSPGGSPVQSSLIHARIRALADEKGVPVLAFVEDVAASGGYWLALAGDEIWADASSIVGSIGVITRSFGLVDAIARLGVERRVHASGARKGALDPFRPEQPRMPPCWRRSRRDIFAAFKDLVRERRSDRLKGLEDDLFSGAFWSGRGALALGLIDGIGNARTVLGNGSASGCACAPSRAAAPGSGAGSAPTASPPVWPGPPSGRRRNARCGDATACSL